MDYKIFNVSMLFLQMYPHEGPQFTVSFERFLSESVHGIWLWRHLEADAKPSMLTATYVVTLLSVLNWTFHRKYPHSVPLALHYSESSVPLALYYAERSVPLALHYTESSVPLALHCTECSVPLALHYTECSVPSTTLKVLCHWPSTTLKVLCHQPSTMLKVLCHWSHKMKDFDTFSARWVISVYPESSVPLILHYTECSVPPTLHYTECAVPPTLHYAESSVPPFRHYTDETLSVANPHSPPKPDRPACAYTLRGALTEAGLHQMFSVHAKVVFDVQAKLVRISKFMHFSGVFTSSTIHFVPEEARLFSCLLWLSYRGFHIRWKVKGER